MKTLVLRNRQQTQKLDSPFLRTIIRTLLGDLLEQKNYELGIHLVAADEMARVNETFLQHGGSTDVITFDYAKESAPSTGLHGELFISIPDAVAQARQFRTTWMEELVRYIVHGILHLLGHDDLDASARRKMKQAENRLVRELARRFPLPQLAKPGRRPSVFL